MKKEDVIKFWLDSAEQDKESAISMFRNGQYHWSLFVWHLALEKLQKSGTVYVRISMSI